MILENYLSNELLKLVDRDAKFLHAILTWITCQFPKDLAYVRYCSEPLSTPSV